MISQNNFKLLALLSNDARIPTKEISSKLKISQQAGSAAISNLITKDFLKFDLIVDPARFGCIDIIVGFELLQFSKDSEKRVVAILKKCENITKVEVCSRGVDLLLEYSVNNLSHFNKVHSELVQNLKGLIKTKFVLPIIVKHLFSRDYLWKSTPSDSIVCGDREVLILSPEEKALLSHLSRNSRDSIRSISEKTRLGIKKLTNMKKNLEKKGVIKKYSCTPNFSKYFLFRMVYLIRFNGDVIAEINRFIEYSKTSKNIIEVSKLIGKYQLLVIVEDTKDISIFLKRLRSLFSIEDYLIMGSEEVTLSRNYIPNH